jgi:crotonobetainyl-CoA:carnitine CoA-transferase CaiB-like acyl-CoA transferase
MFAGMDRNQPGPVVRDASVTDTDALLGEVGYSAAEIAALREQGAAA